MGRGRYIRRGARATADASQPLDIRRFRRAGVMLSGHSFEWQWTVAGKPVGWLRVQVGRDEVKLFYQLQDAAHRRQFAVEQPVSLTRTVCAFGGSRAWWVCPSCSSRRAVLHRTRQLFACRLCLGLAYESQREKVGDRALRRARAIRKRLGGGANMFEPFPLKPHKMRWETYLRLRVAAEASLQRSLQNTLSSLRGSRLRYGELPGCASRAKT